MDNDTLEELINGLNYEWHDYNITYYYHGKDYTKFINRVRIREYNIKYSFTGFLGLKQTLQDKDTGIVHHYYNAKYTVLDKNEEHILAQAHYTFDEYPKDILDTMFKYSEAVFKNAIMHISNFNDTKIIKKTRPIAPGKMMNIWHSKLSGIYRDEQIIMREIQEAQ